MAEFKAMVGSSNLENEFRKGLARAESGAHFQETPIGTLATKLDAAVELSPDTPQDVLSHASENLADYYVGYLNDLAVLRYAASHESYGALGKDFPRLDEAREALVAASDTLAGHLQASLEDLQKIRSSLGLTPVDPDLRTPEQRLERHGDLAGEQLVEKFVDILLDRSYGFSESTNEMMFLTNEKIAPGDLTEPRDRRMYAIKESGNWLAKYMEQTFDPDQGRVVPEEGSPVKEDPGLMVLLSMNGLLLAYDLDIKQNTRSSEGAQLDVARFDTVAKTVTALQELRAALKNHQKAYEQATEGHTSYQ